MTGYASGENSSLPKARLRADRVDWGPGRLQHVKVLLAGSASELPISPVHEH
jgi:hypothetical protein